WRRVIWQQATRACVGGIQRTDCHVAPRLPATPAGHLVLLSAPHRNCCLSAHTAAALAVHTVAAASLLLADHDNTRQLLICSVVLNVRGIRVVRLAAAAQLPNVRYDINVLTLKDHVAATFGAGLGYACVVDVGDQKTSVSCVEDAISHPATRLRLDYGGCDVTQVFYWLLKKCGFPHQVNLSKKLDAMLLNKLKHEFCHVNLNECGAQEKTFSVHTPGEIPSTYTIQMGDELIVAALSLFYPDLLKITGTKRRGGREAAEAMEVGGGEGGDAGEEDIVVDDQPLPPAQVAPSTSVRNDSSAFSGTEKLFSLEQAILTSIDRCQSDEMKRKMYSSILIVGGGAKFKSIGKWLQSRLALQIPVAYRPEQIEIITRAKDMDPCMTAWKGAALMTCLEGSNELWIQQSEWNKHGVKILREKCPFIW
ncbi:Actin-related protein 8-like 2, partial [Homarus americanus]